MKLELHFVLAVFCHSNALLIERDLILIESVKSGSRKRRISEAEPAASEDPAKVAADDLPLNDALKKKWATGVMSFKDVHELAEAAMRQSAHGIARMAQIGTKGRHPENGRSWLLVQGAQGRETHSLCPEAAVKKLPSAALNRIQPTPEEIEKARALLSGTSVEDKKKKKSLNNSMMQWLNKNKDCADNAAAASSKEKEREECLVKFFAFQARAKDPTKKVETARTVSKDPEGFEWEEYQERPEGQRDRRPLAGLAEAWQRNYNSGSAWSMVTAGYWGRAEEAATITSTTNMGGEPTNTSTTTTTTTRFQPCSPLPTNPYASSSQQPPPQVQLRSKPGVGVGQHSHKDPHMCEWTRRVTQFRRQDLKRKETSLKVWLVPENWSQTIVAWPRDNSSLAASSSQEMTSDEMVALMETGIFEADATESSDSKSESV